MLPINDAQTRNTQTLSLRRLRMQNLIFANKLYDADKRTDAGPGVVNESDPPGARK